MKRLILGLITHGGALAIGFALGVYLLPVIIEPEGPDAETIQAESQGALFTIDLPQDLRGNDFLHWGTGTVSLSPTRIVHDGELAPGPDYKLYLTDRFVEHEDEFLPIKADAQLIGDVNMFGGFVLEVPEGVDVSAYTTLVIWCEHFGEFITAAQYR